MSERIDILTISPEYHQALACMFYARLPKEDPRYKSRKLCFELFQKRFGKKVATYNHSKDTYDVYFDTNNRVGWVGTTILSRGQEYQDVFDLYKDYEIDDIEVAVNDIIKLYSESISNYIALRLTEAESVHRILNGEKDFVVDRITDLQDELKVGKIIFVALGGDKGKAEVDWDTGFYAIAHVSKVPYDIGYEKNKRGTDYFKFDMQIDLVLDEPIPRSGFITYPDTYDAPYIGLEIHRDRSQANSSLEDVKAVAIVRATIDKMPHLKDSFEKIFPKDFMDRVYGAANVLVPTTVNYGEEISSAISETLNENTEDQQKISSDLCLITRISTGFDWNRILFGAPGTGKSFTLEHDKDTFVSAGGEFERVTFHPDYTYAQFVGTYKPRMKEDGEIEYAYTPGPFMRTLVNAYKNGMSSNPSPVLLIIEEINRANMAAVFGDIFQLLDREGGVSQYPIQATEDMKKYLNEQLGFTIDTIQLPDNLYIWATMNSADQGVFPMDTAFKRRWTFEYMGINAGEDKIKDFSYMLAGKEINWNNLRKSINEWMSNENINEDKQLGPYFISKQFLDDIDGDSANKDNLFIKMFADKVIMYLFEDACRPKRERLFANVDDDKNYKKRYSSICEYFKSKGIDIFNQEIRDKYNALSSKA